MISQKESRRNRKSELITTNKIEAEVKNLSSNKSPGLNGFMGECYSTFKEEVRPFLLKLFQKIQEEGRLPSSLYETSIILIPKPAKDTTKRKLEVDVPYGYKH